MCGRFSQDPRALACQELVEALGAAPLAKDVAAGPRYNLAPTQLAHAVVQGPAPAGARSGMLGFGFRRGGANLILNARAETLPERPTFAGLLAWHRCLIAATGFYEWQAAGPEAHGAPAQAGHGRKPSKIPHYFTRADGAPFCFAALRSRRDAKAAGERPAEFVIVTCAANPVVAPVHARMPVMLDVHEARAWLSWDTDPGQSLALLRPYAGAMRSVVVGQEVNNARNDSPNCIAPLTR